MAEGAAEGQPKQHNQEAKKATEAQHRIDSPATLRQQPTESEHSREERQARISSLHQRIQQAVEDAEKLSGQFIQAANTLNLGSSSSQTPSKKKEQKKTDIRGLINRGYETVKGLIGVGGSKST